MMSASDCGKAGVPKRGPGPTAGPAQVAGFSPTFLDQILIWIARARERRQLARLSDHMLKDIGISRVDAEWESRRRPWQS